MSRFLVRAAFGLALPLAFAAPAAAQLGPDAAACRSGGGATGSAILVNVNGFRERTGNLRVQLYRADSTFLARGRWLQRIDLPVTRAGPMRVCVPVAQPGSYAIAVRHDMDGNGSSGWNDGGGFSRNPRIRMGPPRFDEVRFQVGASGSRQIVQMKYLL